MVVSFLSPILESLEKIETLYRMTLRLTEEAEEIETWNDINIDRLIEIEEIRKENLEKVDFLFKEVVDLISTEKTTQEEMNEELFLHQRERLLRLLDQMNYIDKKRATRIEKEQSTLISSLQDLNLGKQAVMQYQKAIPT